MNKTRFIIGALVVVALFIVSVISVNFVRNSVEAEDVYLPLTVGESDQSVVLAFASIRRLNPGDTLTVSCSGTHLSGSPINATTVQIACNGGATPSPTATAVIPATATAVIPPTATVVGATATPMVDHSNMFWHAPGSHAGIAAHDHGDSPPQWLLDAGVTPSFDHAANTPNENTIAHKHTAMKGWSSTFGLKDTNPANDVKWYAIFHLDFNPGGHVSRFHSYQLWLQDKSLAVSHMHGWLDFGKDNDTNPQVVITCGVGSNIRPIMKLNARLDANGQPCTTLFETWYANDANPGLDIGLTISPNYFALEPGGDPANPATWIPVNVGQATNMNRRIEFAIYETTFGGKRGDFWTTQFGDDVSGETDPICDGLHTRQVGTKIYTLLCIKQTVQQSLPEVKFDTGNSVQTIFPGGNVVKLPN